MKRILVPTDFSRQANNALDFACQIAKANGDTQINLVHVIEAPSSATFNTMGEAVSDGYESQVFVAELLKKTKKDLDTLVQKKKSEGFNISGEVKVGNPFSSIAKSIAEMDADLVVMGTKGASGMEEVLIGSNTERMVRHAKCPVITIKEQKDYGSIQNMVFATHLTGDQHMVVEKVKQLQEATGATLHLLHVNTPNHFHTQRQVEELFEKFIAEHQLTNCTTHIYNDATEEDGILYFAEDNDMDLIAMATHGRRGFLHLLTGSIAEDLVNHSKIPVWTYSMKGK